MMKWNLILPAIDEIPIIRGAGVPTGTPPFNGARYLDTTTGVVYLGRNVLNFNNSRIDLPTIAGVREVQIRFWHNEPSPSQFRTLHDGLSGDATSLLMLAERASTTGNLSFATSLTAVLDGASISNNTTNPSSSVWHTLNTISTTDRKLTRIGSNRTNGANYLGRIADVRALGAGDVLLASYAINEGSGATIIDSVSGQNGSLTLGSGSWILDWVSQN